MSEFDRRPSRPYRGVSRGTRREGFSHEGGFRRHFPRDSFRKFDEFNRGGIMTPFQRRKAQEGQGIPAELESVESSFSPRSDRGFRERSFHRSSSDSGFRSYSDRSDRPFERSGDRPERRSFGRPFERRGRERGREDRPFSSRPSFRNRDRDDRGERPFRAGHSRFERSGDRPFHRGRFERGQYEQSDWPFRPRAERRAEEAKTLIASQLDATAPESFIEQKPTSFEEHTTQATQVRVESQPTGEQPQESQPVEHTENFHEGSTEEHHEDRSEGSSRRGYSEDRGDRRRAPRFGDRPRSFGNSRGRFDKFGKFGHHPFPKPIKPMAPRYLRADTPAPEGSEKWEQPWAQMRTYCFNPCVFPAMVGAVSPEAKPGDWVKVYDREGTPFGAAFYNPKAKVPLRVLAHGDIHPDDDIITTALDRAITLRHDLLHLPDRTNAYRVINSDGDGLSGLIVDRYADVLSVEVHSLGIAQRITKILDYLHEHLGTQYETIQVDEHVRRIEGIKEVPEPNLKYNTVKITENGVKFEVDFSKGHKTGFFCDQRENRLKFSTLVKGKRVLDLCCYTGGFSVMAGVLGGAAEITGVDLDEDAIAQAKRHGNINGQEQINWVHADAFSYARQMQSNGEKWDIILLDPPKFVDSREEEFEGWGKYKDLNKLGISLLNPGGILVTCSCSGLVSLNKFEDIVVKAAHRNNRRLQFFDCTSAGGDHPIYSNCPESRYLKVFWTRVI